MADVAWDAYHALAPIPGVEALLQPGATSTSTDNAASQPSHLVAFPAGGDTPSALPPYAPPQGKAVKTMEEPPAGGANAWALAGSALTGLRLTFARPLVPPWAPPPSLGVPAAELAPARPQLRPHAPPRLAAQRLRERLRDMARALAQELVSDTAAAQQRRDVPALAASLAEDGRLQQLREELKRRVVDVAVEQLTKDLDGRPLTAQQAQHALKQLHAELSGALREVMAAELEGGAPTAAQPHGGEEQQGAGASRLPRLLELAAECEAVGDVARAGDLHQQRVLLAESAGSQVRWRLRGGHLAFFSRWSAWG